MSKSKLSKVTAAVVDKRRAVVKLTLECGHSITQTRSILYLSKPRYVTLKTPGGKPLKAHCDVCLDSPGPTAINTSIEKIITKMAEIDREFDGVTAGIVQLFIKKDNNRETYKKIGAVKNELDVLRSELVRKREALKDIQQHLVDIGGGD